MERRGERIRNKQGAKEVGAKQDIFAAERFEMRLQPSELNTLAM